MRPDESGYWWELVEYDLETARVMLRSGRYLYVGFMCHQVVEKALKAAYAAQHQAAPPKTHNLGVLAESAGMLNTMPPELVTFLKTIGRLNIKCRYPDSKEELARLMTEERSRKTLTETTEFLSWIKKQPSP